MSQLLTFVPHACMLYPTSQSFPLSFAKDAPPVRTTRELPASAIFSTKFTEVTYKKGFKNCPLCKTFVLRTGHQVNRNYLYRTQDTFISLREEPGPSGLDLHVSMVETPTKLTIVSK